MKKIVPFKKDIIFKTDIEEVTSISLEHTLEKKQSSLIGGNFIINGEYRITENSISTENFLYELPFEINLDEKYELKNITIDIDDFYYEIINNKVLSVRIEVLIDNLEEKEIIEEDIIIEPIEKERCIDLEDENITKLEEKMDLSENTEYKSYKVYIIREGDTIDTIMQKYGVSKSDLENYNDLSNININDKILIPSIYETNS